MRTGRVTETPEGVRKYKRLPTWHCGRCWHPSRGPNGSWWQLPWLSLGGTPGLLLCPGLATGMPVLPFYSLFPPAPGFWRRWQVRGRLPRSGKLGGGGSLWELQRWARATSGSWCEYVGKPGWPQRVTLVQAHRCGAFLPRESLAWAEPGRGWRWGPQAEALTC